MQFVRTAYQVLVLLLGLGIEIGVSITWVVQIIVLEGVEGISYISISESVLLFCWHEQTHVAVLEAECREGCTRVVEVAGLLNEGLLVTQSLLEFVESHGVDI